MKTKPSIFRSMSIVLFVLFLAGCNPQPDETPIPAASITVTGVSERETTVGLIEQKKTFNQCDSASPIRATIQFSETSGQTSQKELVLKESGGLQVELPTVAGVKVEAAVEEHFAVTKQQVRTAQESISIEVPAYTRQEYTIYWRESRREGTIEYIENGETKFINYSYRLGVELDSSSVRNIDCSSPTATPIPTFTPAPTITPESAVVVVPSTSTPQPQIRSISEGCIHSQTWTPDSTDMDTLAGLTQYADGCYSMEALGIFTDANGTLHLNYRDRKSAIASGIYTPIKNNAVIQFDVYVNSMFVVYEEYPAVINFAVAPAGDVMTTRNTSRFKLQVEASGDRPLVYFMLADVNESNGTKVPDQHYEYGRWYTIRLELAGNSMQVYINNQKMDEDLLIPAGQKVFYIGYNVPIIAGVDVAIKNLTIDGTPR